MWRVRLLLRIAGINSAGVTEKGIFKEDEARAVYRLTLDDVIDDLERDEAYDFGGSRAPGEEGRADLPCLRIRPDLGQEVESLCFKGLVRGRVPGDGNSVLDLR